MSSAAIVMMLVAIVVIWGGLAVAVVNLRRRSEPSAEPRERASGW